MDGGGRHRCRVVMREVGRERERALLQQALSSQNTLYSVKHNTY